MADASAASEHNPSTVTTETVSVTVAGQDTASAEVTTAREPHQTATVHFDSAAKRVPATARRELVDTVMDHPAVAASDDVDAVVPRSDPDTIMRLQQRTTDFQARAAGVTSIIHANIPHGNEPA